MKYNRLVDKFEKLASRPQRGKRIKPEKLAKLQQLLNEKKSRYEARLAATPDSVQHKKLEARLKVVNAQLEKSEQLSSGD